MAYLHSPLMKATNSGSMKRQSLILMNAYNKMKAKPLLRGEFFLVTFYIFHISLLCSFQGPSLSKDKHAFSSIGIIDISIFFTLRTEQPERPVL